NQLQHSDAAAVGGPNLTPEDGWLAGCVAASPGQPMHVLESDHVADHIPGRNMAFRREALEAINGFDPQYRKPGDDVDLCWRLQQAGYWITFAPGACGRHPRRQNPRAYLRQQAGHGEAEARLAPAHERLGSRLLVMALCYVQPLIRSWYRYRTRLLAYRAPAAEPSFPRLPDQCLPLCGTRTAVYWTEEGYERTELLGLV